MIPKHIFVSLLLIMIVGLSILSVGCTAELNNSTPSEDTVSVDQAKDLVRNYTGSPSLELTLNSTQKDSYLLESDNYMYYINRTSGSVYPLDPSNYQWLVETRPEIIDLEQGHAIAEAYAGVNDPDLFQEYSTKEFVFSSYINDFNGGGRRFDYNWDEYLYYPDKFTEPHVVIDGLNWTSITLSPYTGEIGSHFSGRWPLDPTLSLTPTLTEEQALKIAKAFATEKVFAAPRLEWTKGKLTIYRVYGTNTHHLAWHFDVYYLVESEACPNTYAIGGMVYVDAHAGTILGFDQLGYGSTV